MDGGSVSNRGQENIHSNSKPSVTFEIPEKSTPKKLPLFTPSAQTSQIEVPMTLHEKDTMIQKLHFEVQNLKFQLQDSQNDNKESLSQLESLKSHYEKTVNFFPFCPSNPKI